ncbi:DNA polymeras-like protein subunit delta-2 [Aaosphaeria arxii CBS 175.79]|uniref:DNA-directed DNA polymerase n=1 Tax=Aaosphaeria arxii CBS 175.79 TaxID=1450172 RepID=A0A6A5XRN5_9PLEO|nr:DNA polymeras-like protein subunit delta-2 [Aaosphaeria arxii CBS 175.79]KAF2015965.1 DNA polymeras-like protein subunit delta-2 [Aaosphaeria arxii CBS 175.79]
MVSPDGNLLKGEPFPDDAYIPSREASAYNPLHTFELPKGSDKHYKQQFADMYFLRLSQLKEAVRQRAEQEWGDFKLGKEKAVKVDRVLDVRQGELCWVIGTVYMEMALKPNILDDISKEHWIFAPPTRDTYISSEGQTEMMLEDESGRLRITGGHLEGNYVTGCVLAALGTEQADGSFEVIATQHADLPRQPQRWERDDSSLAATKKTKPKRGRSGKMAVVSGLDITGTQDDDINLDLLVEYLTGEVGADTTQKQTSAITRLVIAGDSLAHASPIPSREEFAAKNRGKKHYGYDASAYNSSPPERLDEFLSEILPSLPITLLPGPSDPANVALPQQPLHPAMFPKSRQYAKPPVESNESLEGLDSVTNPWEGDIEGWRVLGTGGQTISDLLKYIDNVNILDVMEMMLRWRCIAPTAPDTLWCYPFQDDDPLIVKDCPHIYFAGNQPKVETRVISGVADQEVLLVAVPRFSTSKTLVLIDMETRQVDTVDLTIVTPRK